MPQQLPWSEGIFSFAEGTPVFSCCASPRLQLPLSRASGPVCPAMVAGPWDAFPLATKRGEEFLQNQSKSHCARVQPTLPFRLGGHPIAWLSESIFSSSLLLSRTRVSVLAERFLSPSQGCERGWSLSNPLFASRGRERWQRSPTVFILKCHCSVVLQRRVNRPPFMSSQIMEATLGGCMPLLKV
jgi:hypothetical protein